MSDIFVIFLLISFALVCICSEVNFQAVNSAYNLLEQRMIELHNRFIDVSKSKYTFNDSIIFKTIEEKFEEIKDVTNLVEKATKIRDIWREIDENLLKNGGGIEDAKEDLVILVPEEDDDGIRFPSTQHFTSFTRYFIDHNILDTKKPSFYELIHVKNTLNLTLIKIKEFLDSLKLAIDKYGGVFPKEAEIKNHLNTKVIWYYCNDILNSLDSLNTSGLEAFLSNKAFNNVPTDHILPFIDRSADGKVKFTSDTPIDAQRTLAKNLIKEIIYNIKDLYMVRHNNHDSEYFWRLLDKMQNHDRDFVDQYVRPWLKFHAPIGRYNHPKNDTDPIAKEYAEKVFKMQKNSRRTQFHLSESLIMRWQLLEIKKFLFVKVKDNPGYKNVQEDFSNAIEAFDQFYKFLRESNVPIDKQIGIWAKPNMSFDHQYVLFYKCLNILRGAKIFKQNMNNIAAEIESLTTLPKFPLQQFLVNCIKECLDPKLIANRLDFITVDLDQAKNLFTLVTDLKYPIYYTTLSLYQTLILRNKDCLSASNPLFPSDHKLYHEHLKQLKANLDKSELCREIFDTIKIDAFNHPILEYPLFDILVESKNTDKYKDFLARVINYRDTIFAYEAAIKRKFVYKHEFLSIDDVEGLKKIKDILPHYKKLNEADKKEIETTNAKRFCKICIGVLKKNLEQIMSEFTGTFMTDYISKDLKNAIKAIKDTDTCLIAIKMARPFIDNSLALLRHLYQISGQPFLEQKQLTFASEIVQLFTKLQNVPADLNQHKILIVVLLQFMNQLKDKNSYEMKNFNEILFDAAKSHKLNVSEQVMLSQILEVIENPKNMKNLFNELMKRALYVIGARPDLNTKLPINEKADIVLDLDKTNEIAKDKLFTPPTDEKETATPILSPFVIESPVSISSTESLERQSTLSSKLNGPELERKGQSSAPPDDETTHDSSNPVGSGTTIDEAAQKSKTKSTRFFWAITIVIIVLLVIIIVFVVYWYVIQPKYIVSNDLEAHASE